MKRETFLIRACRASTWSAFLQKPLLMLFLLGPMVDAAVGASNWILVTDPQDMADSSGDIRSISAFVKDGSLHLSMTVEKVAAPSTEQTPEGMNNRYYYHWLLDIDNNPATGRSNAEYEGTPTGVKKPIGAERVIMIGWQNGKPGGIEMYDPANEDVLLKTNFTCQASGNTLTAILPLSDLGLIAGQTIAISAFQEGSSDGWAVDWMESAELTLNGLNPATILVTDPPDMADSSGDIRALSAQVMGGIFYLSMTVEKAAAPSTEQTPEGMNNRYYYHWLLDTDNNPATGRSNAEYEGTPTGVKKPIGAERMVMIGWRDGKPGGIEVYDPANEDVLLLTNFPYQASGNTLTAMIPLADLGLTSGQTIGVSAFQEGSSDGWAVDWMESATLTLSGPAMTLASVNDPQDMADSSGDIRNITGHVEGTSLFLSMTIETAAAPAMAQTPEGMNNRYYYHWLLDTDNNPATGRSNSEYEGDPTGVKKPIGAERVILIGWQNGTPGGIEMYDPANEDVLLKTNFTYQCRGNTLTVVMPLADIGLTIGQTIGLSAFQEGSSDGWAVDWMESATLTLEPPSASRMKIDGLFPDWAEAASAGVVTGVGDPPDMADSSGDIRRIEATVEDGYLYLRLAVQGLAMPSVEQTPEGMNNRYYYHWLLDTDNNPATGRRNAEYEGTPTGVIKPIGAERVIMLGWKDGNPNGVEMYDPANEDVPLLQDFEFKAGGDSIETRIRLSDLGLSLGQTIALSAFQEGSSDGWAVDWMESVEITLTEGSGGNMTLNTIFSGDPVGFEITVEDAGTSQVNPSSVVVRVDGQIVAPTVTKPDSVTTIVGHHPALLPPSTLHTVSLSLQAGGKTQSKDFVLRVDPYTVLPGERSLKALNKANAGFLVNATQISAAQTLVISLHTNIAQLAEDQLAGKMKDEVSGAYYYNEVADDISRWSITSEVAPKTINWYQLAPGVDASLNFPNDESIPRLIPNDSTAAGVVVEILTYLELPAGYHKLGLYTEGGHKATLGFRPTDTRLSLFDNSTDSTKVPTYYGRSQFFDVVAAETGFYPIRFLWFQSARREEAALMLEVFSMKDRQLHLLNDTNDAKSLRAYRAGDLLHPAGVTPAINAQRQGNNLILQWNGMLQSAGQLGNTWNDYADDSQSPLTLPLSGAPMKFLRARNYAP